jgi:hypothetical protein
MTTHQLHHWHIFGCSIQGATHRRTGAPNQDAVDWLATYGGQQPVIALAVADGHGGARYVRSDVGAQLAVRVCRAVLRDLAAEAYGRADLAVVKDLAEHHLPALLVRAWRQLAEAHLAGLPLTEEELAPLTPDARASLQQNPLFAYGSTVVAALLTADFLLYLQLGDGDIVVVDADGAPTRPPLPADPHLFADATSSLCMADAGRAVRTYFQPLADRPPRLILLATDGYANSFVAEPDCLQAAYDIDQFVRMEPHGGIERLRKELPQWLRMTSDQGSGDDITVGILYHQP